MTRLIVNLVGSFVIACATVADAQPTGETLRDAQAAPVDTATVRGRVYSGATKRPLSGVQIRMVVPNVLQNASNVWQSISDDEGRFVFERVAPGPYVLAAQKAGYVTMNFGQERWGDPYQPINLKAGEVMDTLDFTLPPGAAITGTIVDETGKPVSDVLVAAVRRVFTRGARRLTAAGRSATTNDVGEFRLSSLPPGDYYVLATFGPGRQLSRGTRDYASAFYPGTADVSTARAIALAAGRTVRGINIALPSVQPARVSGTAFTSDGRPLVGFVTLSSQHRLEDALTVAPAQIRTDGSFVMTGVLPGVHWLSVLDRAANRPDKEFATTEITVTGIDLTDVHLIGAKASTISGRITFAWGDPTTSLKPSVLSVGATVVITPTGGDYIPPPLARMAVRDDWSFEAKAWPGLVQLQVLGPRPGWGIKAIRYRGADVTDLGLEVRAGVDLSDAEIQFSDRMPGVSGIVTNGRGKVVKDSWIVVFARDRGKWADARYVRTARADQGGHFSMSGVPATDYLVTALPSIDTGMLRDPEFLARLATHAVRVTVGEGETKTVDLKLTALQDLPR